MSFSSIRNSAGIRGHRRAGSALRLAALAIGAGLPVTSVAVADTILYDGFNYAQGTNAIAGQAGGTWLGGSPWAIGGSSTVGSLNSANIVPGLSFSTFPTSGNALEVLSNNYDPNDTYGSVNAYRQLPSNTNIPYGGTVFTSFLFQHQQEASFANASSVSIGGSSTSRGVLTSQVATFYGNDTGGDSAGVGVGDGSGQTSGAVLALNQTYLAISEFNEINIGPFDTTPQTATMWILRASDYDAIKSAPLTEAVLNANAYVTVNQTTSGYYGASFDSTDFIRLQVNTAYGINNRTVYDELRMFTSLSDLPGFGATSPTGTWISANSGDYFDSGNWQDGTVPNATDAVANFTTAPGSGTTTVSVNSAVTLGTLNFDSGGNAGGYLLTGSGSLTLSSSSSAAVAVTSGNHQIDVPVTLSSNTTIDVAGGSTLLVSQPITGASGTTLTKTSPGVLSVTSITGGSLAVNGGTVTLPSTAHTVSVLDGLSIANDGGPLGSRVYSAQLDVGTSDIIIHNGDVAQISDMARGGQSGASLFTGNGITSSTAAADAGGLLRYAVGVIQNDFDGSPIYDTFDGVPVSDSDILVKFTYFGDADLNGEIDDTDFFLINNGYALGLTGWINGDFDYSGTVDDTDFFLINNAYGNQGGGLRAPTVPEPTGMGLIALGAGAVLSRRRR